MEYVSARFEAVMAAVQKEIKEEDDSDGNNSEPQWATERKNQLGLAR